MSPKKFTTSTLIAFFILTTQVAAQSCTTYCNDYAENLKSCASQFGASVQGNGDDITAQAVECVCVGTGSTSAFYEIGQCYECGDLTGDDLALTEAWILTCATGVEESIDDAVACWNTQLLQGLSGPPCFQPPSSSTLGPSAPPTSEAPTATEFPASSTASFDESTNTAVLGGAPTSTDTAFGSAPTSSTEVLSNTVTAPTTTKHISSSLVTSTKQSSVPQFSSNPAFTQSSTQAVVSSVQPQPTETTSPNTTPTPTKSSLGDRVHVSGMAFVIGVLAFVVLF